MLLAEKCNLIHYATTKIINFVIQNSLKDCSKDSTDSAITLLQNYIVSIKIRTKNIKDIYYIKIRFHLCFKQ